MNMSHYLYLAHKNTGYGCSFVMPQMKTDNSQPPSYIISLNSRPMYSTIDLYLNSHRHFQLSLPAVFFIFLKDLWEQGEEMGNNF